MKKPPKLGQHFLRSSSALEAILVAGDVKNGDVVLEVGPGKGVLTEKLLDAGAVVYAVEKDKGLADELEEKFATEIEKGRFHVIKKDVLDVSPNDILGKLSDNYKAIGNIPYYITGAIIKKFLSETKKPKTMVLMVQKEVAERIVAKNGRESVLSISVKAYGTPRYVKTVPAGAFSPPPKVASAIIAMENISGELFDEVDEKEFFTVVKTGFAHPRKLVAGNLRKLGEKAKEILEDRGVSKARAENLTLSDWKALSKGLSREKE